MIVYISIYVYMRSCVFIWVNWNMWMNLNVHVCPYICAYNVFVCTILLCTMLWGYLWCRTVWYMLDFLLLSWASISVRMNLVLQVDTIEDIREHIQGINQSRTPNHYIGEYAVFELLGTGAFGSVYKVRRRTARQSFMAMKEVILLFTASV